MNSDTSTVDALYAGYTIQQSIQVLEATLDFRFISSTDVCRQSPQAILPLFTFNSFQLDPMRICLYLTCPHV